MSLGNKRKGEFVSLFIYLPQSLLTRFDSFYFNRQTGRAIYGYRSEVITSLLQSWVNSTDRPLAWASGTRRTNVPQMTRIHLKIPRHLNDQLTLLTAGPGGKRIFGAVSQLVTPLLTQWVDEHEKKLLRAAKAGLPVDPDSAELLS